MGDDFSIQVFHSTLDAKRAEPGYTGPRFGDVRVARWLLRPVASFIRAFER